MYGLPKTFGLANFSHIFGMTKGSHHESNMHGQKGELYNHIAHCTLREPQLYKLGALSLLS